MGKDTIVVFDDYYLNKDHEIEGLGCQAIIDNLDRDIFDVQLLERLDRFNKEWGVLEIKMVMVKKRGGDQKRDF